MRLLATADLHYDNARSRRLAEELIDQINMLADSFDALLLIGDTAAGDSSMIEECLARFTFAGPKLFVPGNHELWTRGNDSYAMLHETLPRRIKAAGWHWLQDEPFIGDGFAIVGNIGWYDYSFIVPELGIPRRFYEHKISPGSAGSHVEFSFLLQDGSDIPPAAHEIHARWNDARFVHLGRSDETFLGELADQLDRQLRALSQVPHILVAMHHLPFVELSPELNAGQWKFARAFLGSTRLGELLLRHTHVRTVLCGHSHFPIELRAGHMDVINIGSGYRKKMYRIVDLP